MKSFRVMRLTARPSCSLNGLRNTITAGRTTHHVRCYSEVTNETENPTAAPVATSIEKNPDSSISSDASTAEPRKTRKPKTDSRSLIDSESLRQVMRHIPQPVCVVTAVDFPRFPLKPSTGHSSGRARLSAEEAAGPDAEESSQLQNNDNEPAAQESDQASIIITSPREGPLEKPIPRAMTISSFNSLSLGPRPLITFSIKKPSRTLRAIESARRFNIHVLRDSTIGAELATHFTRGNALAEHAQDDDLGSLGGLKKYGITVGHRDYRAWQTISQAGARRKERNVIFQCKNRPPILKGAPILYVLTCAMKSGLAGRQQSILHVPDSSHVIIVAEVVKILPENANQPEKFHRILPGEVSLAYANGEYRRTRTRVWRSGVSENAPYNRGPRNEREKSHTQTSGDGLKSRKVKEYQ